MTSKLSNFFHLIFLLLIISSKCSNVKELQEPKVASLVMHSIHYGEKPTKAKADIQPIVPKSPEYIEIFLGVIFSEKDFPSHDKLTDEILDNITSNFIVSDPSKHNYSVAIRFAFFAISAPDQFQPAIYDELCQFLESKRVVGVVIIGEIPVAFNATINQYWNNLPALWIKTEPLSPFVTSVEPGPLEINLQIGEKQTMEAVRSVFLSSHWHSFTVITPPELTNLTASYLKQPPLSPKIVSITKNEDDMYEKMEEISRSTRGVVLLLCNMTDARLITSIGRELDMGDGNFVWFWVDINSKPSLFLTLPTRLTQNSTKNITEHLETSETQGEFFNKTSSSNTSSNLRSHLKNHNSSETKSQGAEKIEPNLEDFDFKNQSHKFENLTELNETIGNENDNVEILTQYLRESKKDSRSTNNYMMSNYYLGSDYIGPPKQKKSGNIRPMNSGRIIGTKFKLDQSRKGRPPGTGSKAQSGTGKSGTSPTSTVNQTVHSGSESVGKGMNVSKISDIYSSKERKRNKSAASVTSLPVGLLSLKPEPLKLNRQIFKGSVRLLFSTLRSVLSRNTTKLNSIDSSYSCRKTLPPQNKNLSLMYAKEIDRAVKDILAGQLRYKDKAEKSLVASFEVLSLVPEKSDINFYKNITATEKEVLHWRPIGKVTGRTAQLDIVLWPGNDLVSSKLSPRTKNVFRIVTSLIPPFVMEQPLDENGRCLKGVICHRVSNFDKENLIRIFNEVDRQEKIKQRAGRIGHVKEMRKPYKYFAKHNSVYKNIQNMYRSICCYGFVMDLLNNISQSLDFDFHLYIAPDDNSSRVWNPGGTQVKWNKVIGELLSGNAHMGFTPLCSSDPGSELIDFTAPFYHGGISFIAAPNRRSDAPFFVFFRSYGIELWIAALTILNICAILIARHELNTTLRRRRNVEENERQDFQLSVTLWIIWGLICGHLAPPRLKRSRTHKFFLRLWTTFSIIFLAFSMASITALLLDALSGHEITDINDKGLLDQRYATVDSPLAQDFLKRTGQHLRDHMLRVVLRDAWVGPTVLREATLDVVVGDSLLLDYYVGNDQGCKIKKLFEAESENSYAIGVTKGCPLKESLSSTLLNYTSTGYIETLRKKWFGELPCFKAEALKEIGPQPLRITTLRGVFFLLGVGVGASFVVLICEVLFKRYSLSKLREQGRIEGRRFRQTTSSAENEAEPRRRRKTKRSLLKGSKICGAQQEEEIEEQNSEQSSEINYPEGVPSTSKGRRRSVLNSPDPYRHSCGTQCTGNAQFPDIVSEQPNPPKSRKHRKSASILYFKRLTRKFFFFKRLIKRSKGKNTYSFDYETFTKQRRENLKKAASGPSNTYEFRLSAKQIRERSSSIVGKKLSNETSFLVESPPDWRWRVKPYPLAAARAKALGLPAYLYNPNDKSLPDLEPAHLGENKYTNTSPSALSRDSTLSPQICEDATKLEFINNNLGPSSAMERPTKFPVPLEPPEESITTFRSPEITSSDEEYDGNNDNDDLLKQILLAKSTRQRPLIRSINIDESHRTERSDDTSIHRQSERPSASYPAQISSRDNFEEPEPGPSGISDRLRKLSIHRETQTSPERNIYRRRAYRPVYDSDESSEENYKSNRLNIKETNYRRDLMPHFVEKNEVFSCIPPDSQTSGLVAGGNMGDSARGFQSVKPRVYKKHTPKRKEPRARSAPEPRYGSSSRDFSRSEIPERRDDYDYFAEYKNYPKPYPARYHQPQCVQHSFETYPADRRYGTPYQEPYPHHYYQYYPPRGEPEGEFIMAERSAAGTSAAPAPAAPAPAPAPAAPEPAVPSTSRAETPPPPRRRRLLPIPNMIPIQKFLRLQSFNVAHSAENIFHIFHSTRQQSPDILRHGAARVTHDEDFDDIPPPPPPPRSPQRRRRMLPDPMEVYAIGMYNRRHLNNPPR